MKWMYVILIIIVLIVALICYTNVSAYVDLSYARNLLTPDQERLDHLINRNFAKATAVLEIIAIIIGILGLKTRKKTSIFIIIASLPMLFWSYLMYQNPVHISIDEVIVVWIIYIIGLLVLSVIGFMNHKKKPKIEWDENILDDGYEQLKR